MTRIVPASPDTIREAAALLRSGKLVAFPTETVYGLGANALDPAAVRRIFAAKGRPATNPLIVHLAAPDQLIEIAEDAPQAAPLIARFWPGPLTLVLAKRPAVPDAVTAGGPTVAVRIPDHPVALALLREAGLPIAAPSANRSEQLSPTRAEHVAASLGDAVGLILDGGPATVGLESTVVDVTHWPPRLLRPGMIPPAELEATLGVPLLSGSSEGVARSPGQRPRHYAPRTPLRLAPDIWQEARQSRQPVAVLTHTPPPADFPARIPVTILAADPRAYAARLYDVLHDLDRLGVSAILVQPVPETGDWLAIRDRLRRAAAPAGSP